MGQFRIMNTNSSRACRAAVALLFCLSFTAVVYGQSADDPDPPGRAGRLSLVQGDVSLQPAGAQDWANAMVNRPLTTGDRLWSDQDGRAEVQVGQATVRLGSNTGFSFLNVDDDTIQMRMTAGTVNLRVRSLDSNDHMEIDTPNLALSILRPGNYRVEVNDAGDATVVKVSEGEAEASGGSQDVVVHPQQAVVFRGTDELRADVGSLGAPDAFDSWSLERDRREQTAQSAPSAQYVSPDVTGYEDLDANGRWESDPEYGNVWTPTVVAVDWAPYRYGRWVWVAPWGWTWIDDAPWGYAPFHYGRWARVRDRWCWVPGPRQVRAVYAPALVGWVGTPDFSVSVTVGGGAGVAWFPLGPREVYVPARRYSPRYVERVNVSNTVIVNKTYITNVYENRVTNVTYRNRTVPGAVTAVTRTTFTSAEPVGRHVVRIDEREITRVRASGAAPRIEPPRQSILGMNDAARRNVRTPPEAVRERQVVTKRAPPPSAAHFVRNAGPAGATASMADRVRQRDAAGQRDAGERNDAARRDQAARDQANARNDNNRRDDRPGAAIDNNRGNDRPSASNDNRGNDRPGASNAQRTDERRDNNAGRAPDVARDQRSNPAQDRGDRADRPGSPDRGNTPNATGNANPGHAAAQADRPARDDRPPRAQERERQQAQDNARDAQRDLNAQREQQQRDLNARRDQQQRDQAQRDQQAQRQQRDEQAQRDQSARREQQDREQQAQRNLNAQREQQQREQSQRDQAQREQQAQRELNTRREQQQRDQQAQREQQMQQQQAQREQQAQRQQQAQREQQAQQERQRTAQAARPSPQQPEAQKNDRPQRHQDQKPDPNPQSDRNDRGRNRQ